MKSNPANQPRLAQLSAAQREELYRWLTVEKVTYAKAARRLREQFGLTVGKSALSRFYQDVSQQRMLKGVSERTEREPLFELLISVDRRGRISLRVLKSVRFEGRIVRRGEVDAFNDVTQAGE